ncbi:MAG: hypothetical protein AAFV19_14350 [Pseudomonadota bacterium]
MPGPGTVPSPADAARAYMRSRVRPIRDWLDGNEARVYTLSENAVVCEILRAVPGARDYGVAATRGVIRNWLAEKGRRLQPVSQFPHPADRIPPTESRPLPIVTAVEDAMEALNDGATVTVGPVETTISVSGLTSGFNLPQGRVEASVAPSGTAGVRFRGEDGQASVSTDGMSIEATPSSNTRLRMGVTWEGAMTFQTRINQFNFTSSLSGNRWSVRLTFPTARMPQDVTELGEVFHRAERATRDVITRTGRLRDLGEVRDAVGELSPQFSTISRAVSTASNIAAPQPVIRFGIEASGPGYNPDPDAPRGSNVSALLSVSF